MKKIAETLTNLIVSFTHAGTAVAEKVTSDRIIFNYNPLLSSYNADVFRNLNKNFNGFIDLMYTLKRDDFSLDSNICETTINVFIFLLFRIF